MTVFTLNAKNRLLLLIVFIVALFLSIVLLPIFLLLMLFFAVASFFIVRKKKPLPKGTVELLPAEKPRVRDPKVKSTSDAELEITIEALQRKPSEQNKPIRNPSNEDDQSEPRHPS